MALKNGKPNPLSFFNLQRVEFAVPYFKYTSINSYNPSLLKNINTWIKHHLNNRYYIGQDLGLDQNNTIIYTTKIGFESEKDLSFFILACPHLKIR